MLHVLLLITCVIWASSATVISLMDCCDNAQDATTWSLVVCGAICTKSKNTHRLSMEFL